jgi:CBS domain-containing protein
MIVSELLEGRDTGAICIRADRALVEAAQLLVSHRIGALVVTDDAEKIVGIISERDLTRAIVSHGSGLFDKAVREIMTETVITCEQDESIAEILYLMNQHEFRHMPVVDADEIVGVISIRDINDKWLDLLEGENQYLRGNAQIDGDTPRETQEA